MHSPMLGVAVIAATVVYYFGGCEAMKDESPQRRDRSAHVIRDVPQSAPRLIEREIPVQKIEHDAGYQWARQNSIEDPTMCDGMASDDFSAGCRDFVLKGRN